MDFDLRSKLLNFDLTEYDILKLKLSGVYKSDLTILACSDVLLFLIYNTYILFYKIDDCLYVQTLDNGKKKSLVLKPIVNFILNTNDVIDCNTIVKNILFTKIGRINFGNLSYVNIEVLAEFYKNNMLYQGSILVYYKSVAFNRESVFSFERDLTPIYNYMKGK